MVLLCFFSLRDIGVEHAVLGISPVFLATVVNGRGWGSATTEAGNATHEQRLGILKNQHSQKSAFSKISKLQKQN
jgi:hypothetical protein